ncbi:MAG: helix-turn-helix transcriptional regulator, partial [Eubacteriales bacterium]|nr:helix-turn-helix transcriptional regulator [Eubacteriales bacterium]
MTYAYSELYIENAQNVLAQMFHYAVYDFGMEYDPYSRLFVQSGVAEQFEKGNPRFVAGMSGEELADEVIRRVTGNGCAASAQPYFDRTDAYWTGYTLAWYQWKVNCSFRELFAEVSCSAIAGMYQKYHEMDLQHAADEIDRLRRLSAYSHSIALKRMREQAGISQRDLAGISGVPVRTIQQYEQRQKDIRRAAYETVSSLAAALRC